MTYKSTAVIRKEGKWFVARSLELGVTSQGRTIEEAKKNLKEAVELYLEGMPTPDASGVGIRNTLGCLRAC